MKTGIYILMGLLLLGSFSCQKKEYNDSFTTFAPVYFSKKSVLDQDLQVKYNGEPISWVESRITVPEGEAKFEFYDKRNGETLAEKVVNVSKAQPQSFLVFQPLDDAPVAFIDPNEQDKEEAAPNGYLKIKIANYTPQFLPFERIDVVLNFRYRQGRQYTYEPVDTIEAVGRNLDTATYRLVRRGTPQSDIEAYYLTFKDHATGEWLNNAGGTVYGSHVAIEPNDKNVFTLFLTPLAYDVRSNLYLKKDELYYYIDPKSVFL